MAPWTYILSSAYSGQEQQFQADWPALEPLVLRQPRAPSVQIWARLLQNKDFCTGRLVRVRTAPYPSRNGRHTAHCRGLSGTLH